MAEMIYRKLTGLVKYEENPRTITKSQFKKLCKSIKDNMDYFEARPIILSNRTGKLVVIAGNQRYEASLFNGLKEVPTILLEGLTEEREKEILIRDNVSNGNFNYDLLSSNYDYDILKEWGIDLPFVAPEEPEQEEKKAELKLSLKFNTDEYDFVIESLSKINANKELAILELLNYEQV